MSASVRTRVVAGLFVAGLVAAGASGALIENFDPPTVGATTGQYGNPPAAAIAGPDAGSTGQFLRLVNDNTGNNKNSYVFDRTDAGLYSRIVADFDFRVYSATYPNDPADGFAFMYIPTVPYGATGTGTYDGSYAAEEPNRTGVFGVGFDVYREANGVNDVSVHWNGTELANVTLPNSQIDLDQGVFHHAHVDLEHTGVGGYVTVTLTPDINGTPGTPVTPINRLFIPDIPSYDQRVELAGRTGGRYHDGDLDNITVTYTGGPNQVVQDFEGGGTPLAPSQFATGPGPVTHTGDPTTGNYLRLLNDGVVNNRNSIAFNEAPAHADPGMLGVVADFDFRAYRTSNPNDPADGFALLLIPTAVYGPSGVGAYNPPVNGKIDAEEPNYANVFALGFDMYRESDGVNDASVHWNGTELINLRLNPATQIDLDAGLWHHAHLELRQLTGGTLVDFVLTPDLYGTPGSPVSIASSYLIPGMQLYPFRVEFAGRTGGAHVDVDLDNIRVAAYTPEPTTLSLLGLGGLALAWRRRRRR